MLQTYPLLSCTHLSVSVPTRVPPGLRGLQATVLPPGLVGWGSSGLWWSRPRPTIGPSWGGVIVASFWLEKHLRLEFMAQRWFGVVPIGFWGREKLKRGGRSFGRRSCCLLNAGSLMSVGEVVLWVTLLMSRYEICRHLSLTQMEVFAW